MKNHIIISGTGRNGTTFLMQLLTLLGFNTGFKDIYERYNKDINAGLELRIYKDAPYIVKNPKFCHLLKEILKKGYTIDHVIIPIRELKQVACSRMNNGKPTKCSNDWDRDTIEEQKDVLARNFHKLIETSVSNEIPMTFLEFPRLALDAEYTFNKLVQIFDIHCDGFREAFEELSDPSLIHKF